MKKIFKSALGFSLIELMVTIAIMGVLATLAVPSYRSHIANNKAAIYSNQLLADLRYAKNLATSENAKVTFCQSTSSGSTVLNNSVTHCNNNSSWQTGWFVFSHKTNTPRRNFQFDSQGTQNTTAGISVSGAQPLVFNQNGLTNNSYTFEIKPAGCSNGYQIDVESDGTIAKKPINCP